jgi:hypothetical protein
LTAGANITLSESGNNITIASPGGGGGGSYNNISETADTVYISDYLDVDTATLYVDASENRVGIGTSSPSTTVELSLNGHFGNLTTNKRMVISNDDPNYNAVTLLLNSKTRNSNLGFGKNDTVKIGMAYDNRGFFGIVNSVYDLRDYGFRLNDDGSLEYYDYASSSTSFKILSNGNVGIGTSSPSYPLEMGSGAHVTTGGVWTDASDIKLKTNINYIYPYGLEDIMNLKPTMFDYKNGEKNSLGFIAQDIYEIIPEAISSTIDDNGNETMGVKMVSITATLTKAIQEQQSIIESQATEIEQLKSQIQLILTEIEQLKNN